MVCIHQCFCGSVWVNPRSLRCEPEQIRPNDNQDISQPGISLADASTLCTALGINHNKDSSHVYRLWIYRICYHSSKKQQFAYYILRLFLYIYYSGSQREYIPATLKLHGMLCNISVPFD